MKHKHLILVITGMTVFAFYVKSLIDQREKKRAPSEIGTEVQQAIWRGDAKAVLAKTLPVEIERTELTVEKMEKLLRWLNDSTKGCTMRRIQNEKTLKGSLDTLWMECSGVESGVGVEVAKTPDGPQAAVVASIVHLGIIAKYKDKSFEKLPDSVWRDKTAEAILIESKNFEEMGIKGMCSYLPELKLLTWREESEKWQKAASSMRLVEARSATSFSSDRS